MQKHQELEKIESQLILNEISQGDALEIATTTRDYHEILTSKLKNFAQCLPSEHELKGTNLLVGREQKKIDLKEIINLSNDGSPQLALYCARMPVTRTNEETLRTFYENDLRVMNLIKTSARANRKQETSQETNALLSNLSTMFTSIDSIKQTTPLAQIKV